MSCNHENLVFIVDSPIILLFARNIGLVPYKIIIDCSDGTYTEHQLRSAARLYYPDHDYIVENIDAPSLWFDRSNLMKFFVNLLIFELKLKNIKRNLRLKNVRCVGSRTSSLMLLPKVNNRILLDHGLGEPIERLLHRPVKLHIKYYLKKVLGILFKYFQRPPIANRIYSCFENTNKISQKNVIPFDVDPSSLPKIDCLPQNEKFNNKDLIVVLLGNTPHDGSTRKYEMRSEDVNGNVYLLKRALALTDKNTIVICKFHPSVASPEVHFKELIKCLSPGVVQELFLWDEIVGGEFKMLPVEMLWSTHVVRHIICEHSAAGFTIRNFTTNVEFHLTYFEYRNQLALSEKLMLLNFNLNADIKFK